MCWDSKTDGEIHFIYMSYPPIGALINMETNSYSKLNHSLKVLELQK
jgi:hypothetical protein